MLGNLTLVTLLIGCETWTPEVGSPSDGDTKSSPAYADCFAISELDVDDDGSIDERREHSWDALGRWLGYTADDGGYYTHVYQSDGQLAQVLYSQGDDEARRMYGYNGANLVEVEWYVDDDITKIERYQYEDGHRVSGTWDFWDNGEAEVTLRFETDDAQRIVLEVRSDQRTNTSSEFRSVFEGDYIAQSQWDHDGDGVLEYDATYTWDNALLMRTTDRVAGRTTHRDYVDNRQVEAWVELDNERVEARETRTYTCP